MIELGGGCQRSGFPVFFSFLYTHSATPFFTLKQAIHVYILIDSLHMRENWSNHILSSFFCSTIVFCACFSFIPNFTLFTCHFSPKKKIHFDGSFVPLHDVIGPFLCWYYTEKTLLLKMKTKISLIYHWSFIKGITITFHNNSLCVLL